MRSCVFRLACQYLFVLLTQLARQLLYPEIMGKFTIVNAPWIFSVVWAMLKPLLTGTVVPLFLLSPVSASP